MKTTRHCPAAPRAIRRRVLTRLCALACMTLAWLGAAPRSTAQPRLVAAFRFDDESLPAREGPSTRMAPTADHVEGVAGRAVRVSRPGSALVHRLPETDRRGALDLASLGVRLWYRPDPPTAEEGARAGSWRRLISIGERARNPGNGWWELSLNPDGTAFEFSCAASARDAFTVTSEPVSLRKDHWNEILLDVGGGRVQLHVEGKLVLNKPAPRLKGPAARVLAQGVGIGSRIDGSEPARGAIDEVEFYDAPLGRLEALKRYRVLSAAHDPGASGLQLQWRGHPSDKFEIQRSPAGASNWVTLAKVSGVESWTDTNVPPGVPWDYRFLTNGRPSELGIRAGIRLPPVENRGTIALLIDSTLASDLEQSVNALERDLVADGWRVVRHLAPRHDDGNWSRNTNHIVATRAYLQSKWQETRHADAPLRAVFILGHVVIPYAGMHAEDSHTGRRDNHYGAWPADHYYGDMDGIWEDKEAYPKYLSEPRFPITHNVPGDGKFDSAWVPPAEDGNTRLELAFGRVDFFGMPAFGRGRRTEVELLRQYIDKTARFRRGQMPAQPRAVVAPDFGTGVDYKLMYSAYRTASRAFGLGVECIHEGDPFALTSSDQSAVWGYISAPGHIDRIRDAWPNMVTTAMLTSPSRQPRIHFMMFLASWLGDWAVGENNLMRAMLASRDYGMASFWIRQVDWRFDALGTGGTLADAQLQTANETLRYRSTNRGTTRTITILGDPTLRLPPPRPPARLRGESSGSGVRLQWEASEDADLGYLVYRSSSGWRGPYARITPEPVLDRRFTDNAAEAGAAYLVRAVRLETTGSGSFTNLSLGVLWER